ncbi:histone deacetylase 7 isoform X2 [Sceloporus undulatus]|nr:histone deacetylase 7 isoform X2 [Sceloporus undulatus]XP_042303943.1 histone deacetylase 7 isoform X2 [Sceloporus undulatus]XP_042303945.1 histone deacetylase 7 isoform X2 [Sceloporus undulatus]XP_042303946.1 histone deacetylase 7 isoform X2 [Sceloporus undulatus]XP_042303947.1 histone deacetylase 7 isoform X2 [Sceloporus undulatus]
MDLRIGQRLAKPSPDTALLALKQTQLQHQFLMASLHQQQVEQLTHPHLRVPMEPPPQDPVPGKQEQELRLLLHKDKSKRSAVASMVVKQKLAEVILKKQQAALERTNAPVMPYRSLEPMERESPANPVLPSFFPPVSNSSRDSPEHFPLRKTASEPNLKLRYKAKKAGERRKNPLTRKESAPPSLKRRPPEAIDSSPSSSSTPVSGCSSPNDSLVPEHGALPPAPGLTQETPLAQRLRMQESSLAQFALQPTGSLPALTLGLPASSAAPARGDGDHRTLPGLAHKVPVLTSTHTPLFLPTSLEQHEPGSPLSTRLQPVIILEPSLAHPPLVTVPGLGTVPFHFSHSVLPPERLSVPIHKPLGRTRSEPLPPSSRAVQQQLAYQQHHTLFLERLKQQTLLGKRMSKSEKPRLQQIPSSEDMEAEAGGDLSDLPQSQVEPSSAGSGSKEAERSARLGQPQEEHVLQQAQYAWEQQQRIQQHQLLRRQPPADSLLIPATRGGHRPLSRAHSSPAPATASLPSQDTSSKSLPTPVQEQSTKPRFTTGIVYDSVMLKHQCSCGDNSNHPEHAGRIQSIWSRLQERGLRNQCECLRGRKATLEELQSVHTERHVLLYGTNPLSRLKLDNGKLAGILSQRMFVMLPCGGVGVDSDTIWNELHSSNAARWAAGSVTELAFKVANRQLKNGFAVVRPPGHHADPSTAMGFCFFNSVAIAARQLQQKGKISKILIVDWDVHHGNGTQQVFYRDPNVLYISLHRHDNGNFFPGSGAADEVGSCAGEGFTVNVAWTGGLDPPMGDPEYLAAFRTVVMPIAREFCPDVVLVSAGFDAAEGHPPPLGGYKVSAKCFGYMTRQLMNLAGGALVLALEGGHDLTAICDASEACVSALLGNELEPLPEETLQQKPNTNAVCSLEAVIRVQSQYWSSVRRFTPTVGYSFLEAQRHDTEEVETVTALASLSVMTEKRQQDEPMEEEPMNQ